jgi:hypothetical protein
MTPHLVQVRARRERLILQAAAQRETLADEIERLTPAIAQIDRGVALARSLRSRRALLALAGTALALAKPGRALRWAWRAAGVWRGFRPIKTWLSRAAK